METIEKGKDGSVVLKIQPIANSRKLSYVLPPDRPTQKPIRFYTATTDIKDFIGNVIKVEEDNVQVKCLYRGSDCELQKVRPLEKLKEGQRVMITEHLNVNGELELVATTKRILPGNSRNDLNFVNFGWSDDKGSKYIRIDVYTGETLEINGPPNYSYVDVD